MIQELARFWRTVKHIPTNQLWLRAWITARRKATLSPLGIFARRRKQRVLPIAADPPRRIFRLRSELVEEDNSRILLKQLGGCWDISENIDWMLSQDSTHTHLQRLALHYLEFIEALERPRARSVILDWIENNPPWKPKYWLDSWNSYAISIRTVCMMQWLADSNRPITEACNYPIIESLAEQIRFLSRNLELDIRGNHLIKNIKALLWAGRFFDGPEAESWHRRGQALLWQELDSQFLPDGTHFELSPAYHCQVFADILECAEVLDTESRDSVVNQLKQPAQFIVDMTHADSAISLFSDGGLQMAYSPEACLASFSKLGGIIPEPRTVFHFADSGYVGFKSEISSLFFDCGPSCADRLPAHGHGDILAFEWDLGPDRMIVDAGVFEYEPGAERAWNRSTKAHNTVTVGDRDQCEFTRNFRVGHRAHGICRSCDFDNGTVRVCGEYTSQHADGQEITHVRTLVTDTKSIWVIDDLKSKRPEAAVARLLLHHECTVKLLDPRTATISRGRHNIELRTDGKIEIVKAKWSPNFGERHSTNQIEIHYGITPTKSGFELASQDPKNNP